jgi:hypothetical protein
MARPFRKIPRTTLCYMPQLLVVDRIVDLDLQLACWFRALKNVGFQEDDLAIDL